MTEHEIVAGKRLGRKPPSNKRALMLSDVLTGVVPEHPLTVHRLETVTDWDIRGNDTYGDCGPVSVANSRALITKTLLGVEAYPTLDCVLDLYRRSGNPNFPDDDNGVDMQTMLEEVARNGIGSDGHEAKCVAFAKVDARDIDEIRAAVSIFGSVLFGVDLSVAQQNQTMWDYVQYAPDWGGHAVMAGGYSSQTGHAPDIDFVSWGDVMTCTDDFLDVQLEEAWVVIWPEHLGTEQFQQGVDLAELAGIYRDLTGKTLPIVPPPVPKPPIPDSVIAELKKIWHDIGQLLKKFGLD
jgi:hypothetical protein